MTKSAKEMLRNKLQFYHRNCPADTVVNGYEDLKRCNCGIDSSIQDALKELEAIIESAKPLKREMGLGFSDVQNGYNSGIDDYEANLKTALYGKDN